MVSPHLSLLKWSTAFLILSGYLALATVPTIGPLILVVPLVVLALSGMAERLDERRPEYRVVSRAITIAYCCFLPLSWINLGLMTAVVTLAIFIQCYTLLHQKTARNYYHLFLMSLFLLLAACVQSPEPIIGFVLLMFLISGVWANMMLRIVVEEQRLEKPTDPELVSLDYLMYQGHRNRPAGAGAGVPAMAGMVSAAIIALTAFAFVFTPRLEAGILGRNQTVVQTTGLSETVELQTGGAISEDDTPVMMVQFPDEPDGMISEPDWLYWRVTTLNDYEQNSWNSREAGLIDPGIFGAGHLRRGEDERNRLERTIRPDRKIVYQTIYMDDVPSMGLPALDLVQRVRVDEKTRGVELSWGGEGDLTIKLSKTGARRLNYEVWSEPGDPEPDVLRTAPFDFSGVDRQDFELFTEHGLSDASVDLARNLTADQDTLYDKVVAIEEHLSGPNYLYTLNIPTMNTTSVIDTFIHQTRRGHCELFATALALMLRSQGIPTRVVSGFRGGEWNASDSTYTIRANMAHLWVEVWFPDFGWVIFDPSPRPGDPDRSAIDRMVLLASRAMLKTKIFWFREIVGFDSGAQFQRLRNLTTEMINGSDDVEEQVATAKPTQAGRYRFLVPLVIFVAFCLAVLFGLRRLRWISVPRNKALSLDQIRVVRLYLMLRQRMQYFGVSCAGKTAEDLRAELQNGQWEAFEEAVKVVDLYNTVRFGNRPMNGANLSSLKKALFRLRPAKS